MQRHSLYSSLLAALAAFAIPCVAQDNFTWQSLPDYSHAGYMGGMVPIPDNIPNEVIVSPGSGDDTARIQQAINTVNTRGRKANGYRGAVFLSAGTYQVSNELRMHTTGVVLRGAGQNKTIIEFNDPTPAGSALLIGGTRDDDWVGEVSGTRRAITTPFVPLGSYSFAISNASGYNVGDEIIIWHEAESAWFESVDQGGVNTDTPWELQSNWRDVRYRRIIQSIDGNVITVDAPVYMDLDSSLASLWIYKYKRPYHTTHLGLEDLTIDIQTRSETDETQPAFAVRFLSTNNSWARRVTTKHFWGSGFSLAGCVYTTIEDCRAIEPHSIITSARRYNFSTSSSQLILFKNCFADNARHAYVSNGHASDSGIVFLDSVASKNYGTSESHQRWATGLLYDNVIFKDHSGQAPNQALMLGNRGDHGNAHGWAAANSVLWRCDVSPIGNRIVVQDPPGSAQNYAIGCIGQVTGDFVFDGSIGFVKSPQQVTGWPRSLYEAQLQLRQLKASDNSPPTKPTNFSVALTSPATARLSWSASSDNVGVAGYRVYRNGSAIGTTENTFFEDDALQPANSYSYTVTAIDVANNVSGSTPSRSITTSEDSQPPAAPQGLAAEALSAFSVKVAWQPAIDDFDVAFYRLFQDGEEVATPAKTTYKATGLGAATSHYFSVKAVDWTGKESPMSAAVFVATTATANDPFLWQGLAFDEQSGSTAIDISNHTHNGTLAGSVSRTNGGVFGRALDFNGGRVDLGKLDIDGSAMTIAAWIRPDGFGVSDARIASKASGVAEDEHYWMLSTIDSNGIKLRFRLKTSGATTRTLVGNTTLQAGKWTHVAATYDDTAMRLYVNGVLDGSLQLSGTIDANSSVPAAIGNQPQGGRPFDGRIDDFRIYLRALNASELSASMTDAVDSVGNADLQVPTRPGSLTASLASDTSAQLNWNASSDNIGVLGYLVYRNGAYLGVSPVTSFLDLGLQPSTSYSYTVVAFDQASNESSPSNAASVATPGGSSPAPAPPPTSPDDANAVANGGFESALDSWRFYTSGSGSATSGGPAYSGSSAAKIAINSSASNIQLYQNDVPLQPNTEYRLTFAAYSNSGRDLRVSLQKHSSPYSNYGINRVRRDLSTGWQTFSIDFTTVNFSSPVTDGRIYFWFADDARGGDVYYIDQVMLAPVGAGGSANLALEVAVHGQGSVSRSPSEAFYEAGTQVALSASAADGWVFESWGGDVDSTDNPLTVAIESDVRVDAFFLPADEQSIIDLWYGNEQFFGSIGVPQSQVNILGNVAIADQLQTLAFSLNGVPKGELSTGPDDNIRLARPGDFNIEIPYTDLAEGENQVTIEATRIDGKVFSESVKVNSSIFNVWPQPYSIDWSTVSRIDEVAQVVDGKWELTSDGVRVVEAHYDRVIALGDIEWTDYEVTVPITVHEVLPQDPPLEPLVGVMLRWDGHEKRFFVEQPGTEWRPIGAMGVHGWYAEGPRGGPHFQIFETGSIKFPGYSGMTMDLDTPYYFKFRVESKPGTTYGYYSFKVWKAGQPEPSAWGITRQAEQGLSKGSLLLVAHYVEATFGDIVVTPLDADDEAPTAPQNLRANLLSSGDVSLSWDESSDNVGVTGYRVLRDDSPLVDVASAAHIDSTVAAGVSYRYSVVARDGAGNASGPSNEVVIATDNLPDPTGDLWLGMGFEEEGGSAAVDTSPNGNDGLLDELVLRSETGQFGRALEFSGSGGQVDLGGLDIPGSNFTIAVWIKPDAFGIHDARILSKASGVDEDDHLWMLSTISSNGIKPRVRLKAGSGSTQTLIGSSNVPTGQWTHLAATYNGSRLRLYVNGSLDTSMAVSGSIAQNAAVPAAIGNQPQGGRSFDGLIDDLRIYLGALDASEISSIMNEPVVDPQPAFNAVANGGFESGMDSWSFYTSGSGNASVSGPAYVGAGAAKLAINTGASNIQLYQNDVPLEPNTEYRLTFAAYSNSGRDLRVSLQKHSSPYSNYGINRVRKDLSAGWQSFVIDFTTTNFSFPVNDGRLYFWLADDARAGDVYFIDQVQLAPVGAASQADSEAPSLPPSLSVSLASDTSAQLSWGASSDNVGVAGYTIYRDGADGGSTSGTRFLDQGLAPSTSYTYRVTAYDAEGNESAPSNAASVTTPNETEAPTVPQNLRVVSADATGISLAWDASRDNVGVDVYRVTRDGSMVAEVAETSFTDTDVTAGATYRYKVKAKDAAGNASAASDEVEAQAGDPPSPPSDSPGNVVANGGFESGMASWTFYTSGSGSASSSGPGYAGAGAATIAIDSSASNIQLFQHGIALEPYTDYQLTFVAHSNSGRDLRVTLAQHVAPYTNYGINMETVDLGSDWQAHTINFTTRNFSSNTSDARLFFWFANDARSGDRYYIDEVALTKR